MIKQANTNGPVLDIIRNRWSARSFSDKQIAQADIDTIFEAAGWAASANNEQPWLYFYAYNGTESFEKMLGGLSGGNQPWAKNASVLVASVARKSIAATNAENKWARHDLGMANAHLFLQARSMDIYTHPMAGFDRHIIETVLDLNDDQDVVCMIALGYLDSADKLEEPFKTRELTPRVRKSITEFTTKL